jgi:succinoglycan biosynthesis transport protein ExoP
MLQRLNSGRGGLEAASASGLLQPTELLFLAIALVRRHMAMIAVTIAIFVALAVAYLVVTPAQFRATAVMIMDARRTPGLQAANTPEVTLDNPTVESQAEILRSENIALAVIRDLKLADDPGLTTPSALGSVFAAVGSVLGSNEPPSEARALRSVVEQFDRRLTVRRVGVTFVFEIAFLHPDPAKAAEIANAVADAYVVEQLEAKYQSTRRAGGWLQDRLKELSKQATDAERAVVEFKRQNKIIDSGGRLLNEQQLSELSSQLTIARANAGEAKARLDRVESMLKGDVPDISVTDMLRNEVIVRLRNQYLDLAKREADLIPRVGVAHDSVQKIRTEMREILRSVKSELSRVGESYRSDYEIAKSRLDSLETSIAVAIGETQVTSQAQVELRELDSAAQSYRALYDNFLQRYMEAVQQQSIPLTEARLVTQATPPLRKAEPRFLLTTLGAALAGFMMGFGISWLREAADDRVRSREQLEAVSGHPCICTLPKLKISRKSPSPEKEVIREVSMRPLSRFSEGIRTIKMNIDFHGAAPHTHKVIGIISALPGEGKSTIAYSLADMIHRSGFKVALIDADLRRPSLSGRLDVRRKDLPGLIEVLSGTPVDDAMIRGADGPDLLPASHTGANARSNEFLSSAAMANLLRELRTEYDYIIIDLPPLVPVIDARAIADHVDAFVMVVGWGQTPKESVRQAFALAARMESKIVGSVLNMVDETAESYYGAYGGYQSNPYYVRG